MEGIEVSRDTENGILVCHIINFSSPLQQLIRTYLSSIFHGKVEAATGLSTFSYKSTLTAFFQVYDTKDERTRKGMIGELLAHVLIPETVETLSQVSVMKNKEELSIKKGFDIVFYDSYSLNLWYGEIKSGRSKTSNVNQKAVALLGRAHTNLSAQLRSDKQIFWQSVIGDVHATVFDVEQQRTVRELLDMDSPSASQRNVKLNAILIPVVYHNLRSKISTVPLVSKRNEIIDGDMYNQMLIFAIQKETYQKVELFLRKEITINEN